MRSLLAWFKSAYVTVPSAVLQRRRTFWVLFIVLLFGYGYGASKFELDLSDESMFPKDDPVRIAYDFFRGQFGGDESVYIVYKPRNGDLFSKEALSAVRGIQEDILNYRLKLKPGEHSPLDHMVDVTSLINVSYLEASDDSLISRQFIGDRFPTTDAEREALRKAALDQPDYSLMYISKDAQYGGIVVRTDFRARQIKSGEQQAPMMTDDGISADIDMGDIDITATPVETRQNVSRERPQFEKAPIEDYAAFSHAIFEILDKPEYKSVLEYSPVGAPVINELVFSTLAKQANAATGLALLIVIVALWFLFRSIAAIVWPVAIVLTSAVLTIATLGWLGLSMNLMVNVTILLVLIVGVADAVHVLSGYMHYRNQGLEHRDALQKTYDKSGLALFLTTATTVIGMLSLYLVPIEMVQTFGFSAALGVTAAYIITIVYLPIMIELWRPFSKSSEKKLSEEGTRLHLIQRVLRSVEHLSYQRPMLNISIFGVITVIFLVGLSKIEIDSNMLNLFTADHPQRKMYNLVDEKMAGTSNMEILVDVGTENGLKNPKVLNVVEQVQHYLETNFPDEVTKTRSLANIVKDSNKSLNGGRPEFYVIPQNAAVLDQTIFLFNNANPSDRRKMVSDDYRQGRINVSMINRGSKHYVAMLNKIQPEIDNMFATLKPEYPNLKVTVTGSVTIISKMIDYLSKSQIQGFGTALTLISITLFFAFRSKKLGLIAIVPNLFPLVVMYGLMGFWGISLDVDSLIVAPLMIGIVVDDTIHFITHYRTAVIKHGDVVKAIQTSFREVGQAITFTSIILASSFLAFIWLDHQGLKHFGELSALAIVAALIADLFLLPALLVVFKAKVVADAPQTERVIPINKGEFYAD